MYVYIRSLKFTVESSSDLGVPFGAPRASGASAGSLSVSESEMGALTLRSWFFAAGFHPQCAGGNLDS